MAAPPAEGFLPPENWPALHDGATNLSAYLPSSTTKLVGQVFTHVYDNAWKIKFECLDEKHFRWTILEGESVGSTADNEYKAYEFREGVFLIDFYKPGYEELVTVVYQPSTGQVKICLSGFADLDEKKKVTWTASLDATKGEFAPVAAFQPTNELVGKHVLYRYSAREVYQHFYVSPGTVMRYCLSGNEKGVGNAEESRTWKLADGMYLMYFTEKVRQVETILVVDLKENRSVGRSWSWDSENQSKVHIRFASQASVLNEVDVGTEISKPLRTKL